MSQKASFDRVDGGSDMARVAQALDRTFEEHPDAHARPRAGASFLYKGAMALYSIFYGVVADVFVSASSLSLYNWKWHLHYWKSQPRSGLKLPLRRS